MLNKQITEGRLTATPELKYTQKGTPVCSFTIASEDDVKKEDGTRDTDFVDCVAWKGRAEFITKYLTKGRLVIIEGRPKARTYKDKNGVTHKVTELVVSNIYPADSKRETSQDSNAQNFAAPDTDTSGFSDIDFNDDDLPF